MKQIYLVTGANGHLGSAVCTALRARQDEVRALVLPGENTGYLRSLGAEIFEGDVTKPEELEAFFRVPEDTSAVVIHAAGIVDIACKRSPLMEKVNVEGTRNVLDACRKHAVSKLVYVSSVHAIPELPKNRVISEVQSFSPDLVEGAYAKTKAIAAQLVLDAAKEGLPAVIVHPSGIVGPYLGRANHLVQLVKNYVSGKMSACVKGGYDFVDVRDCAYGCIAAAEYGRPGECYILSNRYYTVRDILRMLREIAGGKPVCMVPTWTAKAFAPLLAFDAKRRGRKPLYTKYSLYTLHANGNFSHNKATSQLGFCPRDIYLTLRDTVAWLLSAGELKTTRRLRSFRRAAAAV